MAAAFRLASAGGGTTGTGNRTSTIAALANDLLIVFVKWSGNAATNPTCTDNGTGTNTYTLIGTALNNGGTDIMACFVRNALVAANATLTIAPVVGSGTNTAGEIITFAITGMTNVGAAALRSVNSTPQFGKQENQTTGVPTPALPANALTGNMTIMAAGSSTTAGAVPNASWTEPTNGDASQASPVTSLEVNYRASGFTGQSAAFVSIASAVWSSMILELDGAVNVTVALASNGSTSGAGDTTGTGGATFTPAAVSASGAVGTVTVDTATNVTVTLSGFAAASAAGSATLTTGSLVVPAGVADTSAVGAAAVTGSATHVAEGVAAAGSLNAVNVSTGTDVFVDVAGLASTCAAGALTIAGSAALTLAAVSSSSAIGTAAATGGATATSSGLPAAAAAGQVVVNITANVTVSAEGLLGTSAVGQVDAGAITFVPLTGVGSQAETGALSLTTGSLAFVVGAGGTSALGQLVIEAQSAATTMTFEKFEITSALRVAELDAAVFVEFNVEVDPLLSAGSLSCELDRENTFFADRLESEALIAAESLKTEVVN